MVVQLIAMAESIKLYTSVPRLSIIIPFYNHEELVKEMVDSILANDFHDWELLLIDDGSSQKSVNILEQYKDDGRIKIIHRDQEPKGAQTCRNIGLKKAQSEYIMFFDSDDYTPPYCLRERVRQMEAHPELDFMVFRSGIYKEDYFVVEPTNLSFGYHIYKDDIAAFCTRFLPFVVWNNIYRRDSLLKHRITWDTKLLSLQDSMFNLECLLAGMKYSYSNTLPDYGYRLDTAGSVSKKMKSQAHLDSHVYITEQFFTLVQQQFGHRHDHSLYRGALQVLLQVARTGNLYKDFNLAMASVVRRHSLYWGKMFQLQVRLYHVLQHLLPSGLARQLSFLGYLIWSTRQEKWKVEAERRIE